MALAVLIDYHTSLDLYVFHLLNRNGGPVLDKLALTLSHPAFGIIFGLVLAGALWWRAHRGRAVVALGLTVLLTDRIGAVFLKPAFHRMRPCYALAHDQVRWLGAAANVGSLPSLHASNVFAIATIVALADRRLAPCSYLVAVAVSLTRIYLGVHWPTDVLAGAVWGSLASSFAWLVTKPLERRVDERTGRGTAGR